MRLKPGQTAPQMPPRGPKGPIKKPLAAQQTTQQAAQQRAQRAATMTGGPKPTGGSFYNAIQNPTPSPNVPSNSIANVGIGRIGGPKPSIPTPVNPSPARPPLNAAPVTGVTRGNVEQNYRGIPGLVNATGPTPNFGGAASNSSTTGFKRSRADFGDIFGMKKGGKVKSFRDGGIYTADMGQPPQDIDGGSAPRKAPAKPKAPVKPKAPPKPVKPMEVKKAKGGSIDGIAQRGKTNCKMR